MVSLAEDFPKKVGWGGWSETEIPGVVARVNIEVAEILRERDWYVGTEQKEQKEETDVLLASDGLHPSRSGLGALVKGMA